MKTLLKNKTRLQPILNCILLSGLALFLGCQSKPAALNTSHINPESEAYFETISLDTMPKPVISTMDISRSQSVQSPTILKYRNEGLELEKNTFFNIKPVTLKSEKKKAFSPSEFLLEEIKSAGLKPQISISQTPFSPDYNPYNFNIFDLSTGLIDSKIHDIFHDSKGNVWFASYIGVSKYNGRTFENFSHKQGFIDSYVVDIQEDEAGNIWFASRAGLSKFDGETISNFETSEGHLKNGVNEILEDSEGNIWLATLNAGLCLLKKGTDTLLVYNKTQGLPDKINCLIEDSKGNIWLGTDAKGLIKYDGKVFSRIVTSKESEPITSLKESNDGSIMFGTNSSIGRYDGSKITRYANIGKSNIRSLYEDDSGVLWCASEYDGLFVIENAYVRSINAKMGLPSDELSILTSDQSGNLWIGTYEGAVRYNRIFSSMFEEDGLTSKAIRSLFLDKQNNLWIGCDLGGISIIDFEKNSLSNYTTANGLSGQNVNAMAADSEGNTWIGFWDSDLCRLSSDRKSITQFKEAGQKIVCLYLDLQGDLWYSSREKKGVFKLNTKDLTKTHYTTSQGLVDEEVIHIRQDTDSNYVFTTFNGVSILNKDKNSLTNYPNTPSQNLTIIESFYQDHTGAYWLNSLGGDGLFRLDRRKNKIRQFTIEDGLPSNVILSEIQDDHQNMWISTRNGLVKVDKAILDSLNSDSFLKNENLFTVFRAQNNFQGNGDGRHHIVKDHQNQIWIPQLSHLARVHLDEDRQPKSEIDIELLNIKLFNEQINWNTDSSYTLNNGLKVGAFSYDELLKSTGVPSGLVLPYDNNFISFEFIGVDVNKPQSVKYQYQLEGLEENWSTVTANHEATYASLSPGKYTFRLKAMNEAGIWSKELLYPFTIRPPWWLSWWAYSLYIGLSLLLIYLWTRYNVYLAKEKFRLTEEVRTSISADLHDDVGSLLAGLAMKSELMAMGINETKTDSLNKISDMSREAMERMRDTVWAIDSRKDKYENLTDRMRAFAEQNLSDKGFIYEFKTEGLEAKSFINPLIRQNLYLILKEAITNVIKHSDGNKVVIGLQKTGNSLNLNIKDNGSGREDLPSDGLGLSNMKRRAEKIGGQLVFGYQEGFQVSVTTPLS